MRGKALLFTGLVATSAVLSVPDRFWSWTARDGNGAVQPVVPRPYGAPEYQHGGPPALLMTRHLRWL